ncbi:MULTISPECIES: carboxypeptidase-like regulatory domain-containing protein [unclassified Lacinutrix]
MGKIKGIIFLLICLACFQISWTQTVDILGEVKSGDDVENIHVINKTSQKFTITNAKGKFVIPAKLNDTLVVSSIQNKLETLIVSIEHILSKKITITLEEQVNELDEVVIGKMLTGDLMTDLNAVEGKPITSLSIGIPSYQGPLKTHNERLLNEATSGGGFIALNPILNAISGRTKKLKNRVRLDEIEVFMYRVKTKFSKDLFEENPLHEDKIMDYFYFVSDDPDFTKICKNKSDLEILVFLKDKLIAYKAILNNKED